MKSIREFCIVLLARVGMWLFALLFRSRASLYRFDIWLLPWLRRRLVMGGGLPPVPAGTCRDIMFCFVDHFEPGTRGADEAQARERFQAWVDLYPPLAERFRDADGVHPRHSFFFPPHYYSEDYIRALGDFDWQELGEVELHLHHENDTSATLRKLLESTLELYEGFGVFRVQGEKVRRRYSFIHGNWALDNSRPQYCGVNDELTILQDTGCYADFTFPSLYESQPRMVNSLYRAVDDTQAPKSYDVGAPMSVDRRGLEPRQGLPILTGPIGLRGKRLFPWFKVEDADVTGESPGTPERVRAWIGEGIHVAGRPEWLFVKVHTHGAPERHREALLGEGARRMYATLCEEFNDGDRFRLHFVTAREMFNIARAAEDDMSGDAGQYRDYEIEPFLTRSITSSAPYRALSFTPAVNEKTLPRADLGLIDPRAGSCLEFRQGLLRKVEGPLARLACAPGRLRLEAPGGELLIQLRMGALLKNTKGETLVPDEMGRIDLRHGLLDSYRLRPQIGRVLELTVEAEAEAEAEVETASGEEE